jgi:tRNA dimethylallyltransferase
MKRRTRNYARRQLTWMRKLAGVEVVDVTGRSAEDVAEQLVTPRAGGGSRSPESL